MINPSALSPLSMGYSFDYNQKNHNTNKVEVSETNQYILDNLKRNLRIPDSYALWENETALADYLVLQLRKNTLNGKERELINLVVSQVNNCKYCLAAHTVIGKMNGFTDEQVLEIRQEQLVLMIGWRHGLLFVKETAVSQGEPSAEAIEALFNAGYTEASLTILIVIVDKIISNYLH